MLNKLDKKRIVLKDQMYFYILLTVSQLRHLVSFVSVPWNILCTHVLSWLLLCNVGPLPILLVALALLLDDLLPLPEAGAFSEIIYSF